MLGTALGEKATWAYTHFKQSMEKLANKQLKCGL